MDTVALDLIDPSPANLRRRIGDLKDLTASIRAVGILEPLIVRPNGTDGRYELVAGHRRHAAAIKAKLDQVPVVVRDDLDDAAVTEAMLIENLQRHDLAPCEEADGYIKLVESGMTIKNLATRVGRSVQHVSGRLRLLELPRKVQNAIDRGDVYLEHADELAKAIADDRWQHLAADTRNNILEEVAKGYSPAAENAFRRLDYTQAVEAAKAKHGDLVVLPAANQYGHPGTALGKGWGQLPVSAKKHRDQPCHRYTVVHTWGKQPATIGICIKPADHVNGTSDLQVPKDSEYAKEHRRGRPGKTAAEKAEAKAERDRAAKLTALAQHVHTVGLSSVEGTRLIPGPVVREILAKAVLQNATPHTVQKTAKILGFEPVEDATTDSWRDPDGRIGKLLDAAANAPQPFVALEKIALAHILIHDVDQRYGVIDGYVEWLLEHALAAADILADDKP